MPDWKSAFDLAHDFTTFLDQHATGDQKHQWNAALGNIRPTDLQRQLLDGFTRRMNVLCLAGAWCPDCVTQCPILQCLAEGSPVIDLRFLDRDAHPAIAEELKICGGGRVPVVVLLSEDFAECGRYGDRTLSVYRALAQEQLGIAPLGPNPPCESRSDASFADWLREFERIQLMLRLSPRLRRVHGD